MANIKLYPFSARKHAHDIEFRRNRVYNLLEDCATATEFNEEQYDYLEKLAGRLDELLNATLGTQDNNGIAWLTGKQHALAKETALWAAEQRGAS